LGDELEAFQFKNEKTRNNTILSGTDQRSFYGKISETFPSERLVLFSSSPTDHEALSAACQILKRHFHQGFQEFEFISPTEPVPYKAEEVKKLYVILAGAGRDQETTHLVRRWARAPLGALIWIIVSHAEPIRWCFEELNLKPNLLFSVKSAATSVG
jgi:hypothetical protein